MAALSLVTVADRMAEDPAPSASSSESNDLETLPMAALGDVPVAATLGLEQVGWGTRLLLTCTYEPQSVAYEPPPEMAYLLFVRTRDGRTEQVGSWRSVGGTTMQVPAATSVVRADIASVEVRTTDGRVVLRLRA